MIREHLMKLPNYASTSLILLLALLLTACGGSSNSNDSAVSDNPAKTTDDGLALTFLPNNGRAGKPGSSNSVKIDIVESGIYNLSLSDLQKADLALETLAVENLNITQAGESIPYLIQDDSVLFYGQAPDSRYSRVRPYILRAGESGKLMTDSALADNVSGTVETVSQSVLVEENLLYEQRAAEVAGSPEVWFWRKVIHTGEKAIADFEIDVPVVTSGEAQLKMHFWGLTYNNEISPDHTATILVNGTEVGLLEFDDQTYFESATTIDSSLLKEGKNTITLNNEGDRNDLDHFYVDWISLSFPVPTKAINDVLLIKNTEGLIEVSDFSSEPVVLDITDPMNPARISSATFSDGIAKFGVPAETSILVAAEKSYKQPTSLVSLPDAEWRTSSHQADLIVVTTNEMVDALNPLVKVRQEQGLTVAVLTIGEVYNEFGFGDAGPQAITNLVEYSQANWADPKPRYLFLVGDATTDPLGYAADRPDDPIPLPAAHVPSLIVEVSHSGETVSDSRMVDTDGDFQPDIAVGRWPVNTAKDVKSLVERTLAYEAGVVTDDAVFAVDDSGGSTEFINFANRLIENTEYPDENALLFEGPTSDEVASKFNESPWLMTYVGHGGLNLWGKDEILTKDAADIFARNVTPPIMLQFSCLTAHFGAITTESISETMMKDDNGPVLLVGSTSLTLSSHQSPFAEELFRQLQNPSVERIGDALQIAKVSLNVAESPGVLEISDTFGLLGDPSALIVRPDLLASANQ